MLSSGNGRAARLSSHLQPAAPDRSASVARLPRRPDAVSRAARWRASHSRSARRRRRHRAPCSSQPSFHARQPGRPRPSRTSPRGAARTIYEAAPTVLDAASPVRTPSGIVAIAAWTPRPIGDVFAPAPALAVGLVDVQDPGNVGAVIRSADALGATGVIAMGATAHPGGWKALRGAMGSTFRLPVARSLDDARGRPRPRRRPVRATVAEGARATDRRVDLRPPTLLLRRQRRRRPHARGDRSRQSDARVTVPMRPGVRSLNVGVTAALILYEARRETRSQIRNSCDDEPFVRLTTTHRCRARRWPSACGRARSTSSSARRICSARAGRCARRSRAARCIR